MGTQPPSARILVVDDEEGVLLFACDLLNEEGYETVAARNAAEAEALLEQGGFDLVVSDIRMPRKSGVELLFWTRERFPDLPFMLITGYADVDALTDALNFGAQYLIRKPFSRDELIDAVQRLLLAGKFRRENLILQQQLSENNARLRQDVVDAVIENQTLFIATLTSLANAIDARDAYTHEHSQSVARLARGVAERLGLSRADCEHVFTAGQVHDIGKIAVPEAILQKPTRLTEEEFAVIKQHPDRGVRILGALPDFGVIHEAVRHHHERFDGTGYPAGLKNHDIPLLARILCICDAWDAMTTDRPYRRKMTDEEAAMDMRKHSGTQFDPEIMDVFLASRSLR